MLVDEFSFLLDVEKSFPAPEIGREYCGSQEFQDSGPVVEGGTSKQLVIGEAGIDSVANEER